MDPVDHARFTRCRNELRSLTRKLRKSSESSLAQNLKQNPKAFCRYASSRFRTKCRVEDLLDDRGVLVSTNEEKAEALSAFYGSIFTKEGDESLPTMRNRWEGPTLEDIDVSPQLVEKNLAALRPGSSPGPDAIHPRALRDSSHKLCVPRSA